MVTKSNWYTGKTWFNEEALLVKQALLYVFKSLPVESINEVI